MYDNRYPPDLPLACFNEHTIGRVQSGSIIIAKADFRNAFEIGEEAFLVSKGTPLVITGFDKDGDVMAFLTRPDPSDHTACRVVETTILKEDVRKCAKLLVR